MKKITILALLALAGAASAQTYVNPHVRKDGTFVEGHYRSAPNNTQADNYSTQGNTNPFTGQQGTVQPNYTPPAYHAPTYSPPQYQQPRCYTASNGQMVCR